MEEAIILVVAGGMALVAYLAARALRLTLLKRNVWKIHLDERATHTQVFLIKQGAEPYFVGSANRQRKDYADKLLKLHSAAEDKMYEWNSVRRVLPPS